MPYLPDGKEIKYVGGDDKYMKLAKEAARKLSTDSLQPTGAVVVLDNEVVGKGANHSALGKNKWFNEKHKKGLCTRKILNIPSGKGYWTCPGCVTNKNHAEGSAIRDALKNVKDISGANLYLWGHWWCCKTCWDSMINAGINQVYLIEDAQGLFSRESGYNILGKQFND